MELSTSIERIESHAVCRVGGVSARPPKGEVVHALWCSQNTCRAELPNTESLIC